MLKNITKIGNKKWNQVQCIQHIYIIEHICSIHKRVSIYMIIYLFFLYCIYYTWINKMTGVNFLKSTIYIKIYTTRHRSLKGEPFFNKHLYIIIYVNNDHGCIYIFWLLLWYMYVCVTQHNNITCSALKLDRVSCWIQWIPSTMFIKCQSARCNNFIF